MLTITRAGLAAVTSAEEQGFKISLRSFKVSEYLAPNPSNVDYINVTDLLGNAVYTGEISVVEVVGSSSVKLTLQIPKELPRSGSWMLRELGIYLDTGELFAAGPLEPAYEKNSEYGIKIYTVCSANRLGEVVTVNVNQNNSVPVLSSVHLLPAPINSEHSVLAVLDETLCEFTEKSTAGLVVKSGPGLLHWAFTGHHRVYYGPANTITDQSTFSVSSANGGFWLNNEEILLSQVVTGAGSGQSRRLRYVKAIETFTVLDRPFENIDDTSVFAIWRDNANQLPKRDTTVAPFMVLSHGLNSWQRVLNPPVDLFTFELSTLTGQLNADSQFGNNAIRPEGTDASILVWCDGSMLPASQYSLSPNVITVYGKPANSRVDLMIIKKIPTLVSSGVLSVFESRMRGDGQTTRFYMSIIPKASDYVAVYVNGVYKHKTEYTFNDTNIVLQTAPSLDAVVTIQQFGLYDEAGSTSEITRTFRQLHPGEYKISLAQPPKNSSQVLLYVDGSLFNQTDYQTLTDGIQLSKVPSYPGGLSFVEVVLITPTITSANPYASASVSGLDTGPQWTDPAGLEGPPNKLIPKTTSRLSDGANTVFDVHYCATRDQVLVFVNGEFLQQDDYSYSTTATAGKVTLNTAVASGYYVDVVCFTESTIDEGFAVECTSFTVTSSTDTVYQLATVTDPESIIVTVGGVYRHKSTYQLDPDSRIYFQGVEPGKAIEAWYFKTVPHTGWRTTMLYTKSGGASANIYPSQQTVDRKQNLLVFDGKLKRDSAGYDINAAGDKFTLNPNTTTNTPVVGVSFNSGPPKTRLLTRAEYNRSVVSFNYRTGAILLTREDVKNVLSREDILALLTESERAVLQGGGQGGSTDQPHAEPGNTFTSTNWVVPAGVYHIRAVIIGGGGGGGGGSANMSYAGHGGKKGQMLVQELDVVPGQQLEVRLGVGGSPYLYTADGTTVYPQPGDFGTSDGMYGYRGRSGENTIFHQWVAQGGQSGGSDPVYAAPYTHVDSKGEDQVPITGTGTPVGGGAPGVTGVQTPSNNVMAYSYPGTNGAFGYQVANSTGGGYAATSPGAGGGGAAADPLGVGAFGGAGANGVVYISW